jgi:transcriptional regulator with XRE-family HTH domain
MMCKQPEVCKKARLSDLTWHQYWEGIKTRKSQKVRGTKTGVLTTQVRRYESGEAQPSLDILKRIAITFNVSADWLIFEDGEREPQDELKLKFEAIKQMDEEELKSVTSILDALILKHQARRVLG